MRADSTDSGCSSSSLSHFRLATAAGREEEGRADESKYVSMGSDEALATTRRFLVLRCELAADDARRFRLQEMAAAGCSSSVGASLSTSTTVEAVLLVRDDVRRK